MLSIIYTRIYGQLWVVYVILMIMLILLGNKHGMIPGSRKSWFGLLALKINW